MNAPVPDDLLRSHLALFMEGPLKGPVLDLACGDGHNGIFLASKGLNVVLADVSEEALTKAERGAKESGADVTIRRVDLEQEGINPLEEDRYDAILVFRFLHRPLIPCIRKALRGNGILIYETFTLEQRKFHRPRNPDFLLRPGELKALFEDWHVIHYFEGLLQDPTRAVAQIVCRKPKTA